MNSNFKRILIATVQVPFIQGGAESHARGLKEALVRAGHEAEIVTMPFRFGPCSEVRRAMRIWEDEDFSTLNCCQPDMVICLKFPTYYLKHPEKRVWLLHQHREVYDLWSQNRDQTDPAGRQELEDLREAILARDREHLGRCAMLFANSENVADRLLRHNGLRAEPLYHPPPFADRFYTAPAYPFIFYPSRLEGLKRQDLLIKAFQYVRSPVKAFISGNGPQFRYYKRLIKAYGLQDRVRLLGRLDRAELLACYARCLSVFYGPYDEDYGYVTLEAMLSQKPVITCTDSGGTLEFVEHGRTGYCLEPEPRLVAESIDTLYADQKGAKDMGHRGLQRYRQMGISWENVVQKMMEKGNLSNPLEPGT